MRLPAGFLTPSGQAKSAFHTPSDRVKTTPLQTVEGGPFVSRALISYHDIPTGCWYFRW